jgi:TolB-like protein
VGIHLGDVVEEADGDLMGDGVNIAARLEGLAKPGAICLSEQAYWQVKGRLDLKVADLGATQLKNIAEPIHVYSLEVGQPVQAKPAASATTAHQAKAAASKQRMGSASLVAAIAALLLLATAGGWFVFAGRSVKPAQAAHLSIVVPPFANLSGDPAQDYFADGITENLTTELSRIKDSFVIARETAFTYKGKSVDAKEIGKELGVRYVLEGSVQRDQNRVRVNAQLIDGESGAHLWADRFQEDVSDLFKLQDEVVTRLADSLGYALIKAEAEKAARSTNPDVIDLTMRGADSFLRSIHQPPQERRDAIHQARALFERALQIDPNDASALAGSANTYQNERLFGLGDPSTDYEAKVLGQVDRAIALDPNDVRAYSIKANYLNLSRRPSEALDVANAGLAINSNWVGLYFQRAVAENSLGRYEQAKADIVRALRLSPRHPEFGWFHVVEGDAEINLGHFDAAIDAYRKAIDLHAFPVYTNLAAAYAHEGQMDEAKAALAEARRLNPAITIKWMKEHTPNLPAVFDGLRKAGLPEE